MRKYILIVVLSLLIIPINGLALSFESIDSSIEGKYGDVEVSITIKLDKWDTIDTTNTGVLMYMIGINYNDNDLSYLGAGARGYITSLYKDSDTNEYAITAVNSVKENSQCAYGVLSCDKEVKINIAFALKNEKCKETTITIDGIYAAVANVSFTDDIELVVSDIIPSTYHKDLKLSFGSNINVTTPKTTVKITTGKIDNIIKQTKLPTTKKITTPKTTITTKSSTISSKKNSETKPTETGEPEDIEKNDIVANVIEDSKKYIEKLKDKDNQKKIIKIILIILGIIILLIILVKLKNHKLNKKFKDF